MKKQFKCWKCEQQNEFETDNASISLMEAKNDRPNVYTVKCSYCGAENSV